jgi:hypothetical protein
MRLRRTAHALIALPWLLATVGVSLRACPDHGDGSHISHGADPGAHTHRQHHGELSVAGHMHASSGSPAAPGQPHSCNCPGTACCTAAVAIMSVVTIDGLSTVAVAQWFAIAAPTRWAIPRHDTRLPFANGPPLSA